jgi:putative phosphonate metabolism protein
VRRFAIYFAPAQGAPLMRLARAWLGRDAFAGPDLPPPPLNGFPHKVWRAATSEPRRYGFHATLKPPFHLAHGATEKELRDATLRLARSCKAFEAPPLKVAMLSSFVALTLSERCPALENLAAACVRDLDDFRAVATGEELARRRRQKLTPQQDVFLQRWGYPYVMDAWRFHMTLTSSLEPAVLKPFHAHLTELVEPHCRVPVSIDSICLFEQPGEKEPFEALERYPLS